jgi:hypothetical protein
MSGDDTPAAKALHRRINAEAREDDEGWSVTDAIASLADEVSRVADALERIADRYTGEGL